MASVFWDARKILFIDYLEKGQTITSDRYMTQLARLKEKIVKKRLHMKKKKAIFHQDNAPCHKSLATMDKLHGSHTRENARRKEIWLEWRWIVLQERCRNVIETLEWFYRSWRKLCSWIKLNFAKKLLFYWCSYRLFSRCVMNWTHAENIRWTYSRHNS